MFLFAGYDGEGIVGPSLLTYLRALSAVGDVVFMMDNACPDGELAKMDGYVLHGGAEKHGEYDFGSYKRCYLWAAGNLDLSSYDYLYLVNDSVFGPLADMDPCLQKMEDLGVPAFSLVLNPHRRRPHLQSWFLGMSSEVFLSDYFQTFMLSVTRQEDKASVCELYENGFTNLLARKGVPFDGLFRISGKKIYNAVKPAFRRGLPFVKKSSFVRHNGSLGPQIGYILDRVPQDCREAIVSDACRLYGKGYVDSLIGMGPAESVLRYLGYLFRKIFRPA